MAGSDSNFGKDPHSRAKRRLDRAARHTEEYLDELKTLTDDAASLARELLNPAGKSAGQLFGDLVALAINAGTPLYGCLDSFARQPELPASDAEASESKPSGQGMATVAAATTDEVELRFDIRSEMAGPIFRTLPEGTHVEDHTDLKGGAGRIDRDQVVIRVLADRRIIVSLRDLHRNGRPAEGTYSGAIVLKDANNGRRRLALRAVCTGELWWNP